MKTCYIFGAGECESAEVKKNESDIVIAADGGYEAALRNGIKPDYVIGDFDSLGYVPENENIIKLKPEKDFTDMYSAAEKGIELGYKSFVIYGATGGRADHTLANYQLAAMLAEKGCKAELINGKQVVTALHNGELCFDKIPKGYISVFAHSDICTGVYEKGLKYELENAELKNTFALGVSNEFIGKESCVSVKNGTLIIIYNRS